MSSPAGGSEYVSAGQRLRNYIEELRKLAEQRLALQRVSNENPKRLLDLWDAVSTTLSQISAISTDEPTRISAREEQLKFDEVVETIHQHMLYSYPDQRQAFEAWSQYRRSLRAELDVLASWISNLTIAVCIVAYESDWSSDDEGHWHDKRIS
jgi:hypothetical protein